MGGSSKSKKQEIPSLKLTANAPENRLSQKESSIPIIHFQVICWFQGGDQFFASGINTSDCTRMYPQNTFQVSPSYQTNQRPISSKAELLYGYP